SQRARLPDRHHAWRPLMGLHAYAAWSSGPCVPRGDDGVSPWPWSPQVPAGSPAPRGSREIEAVGVHDLGPRRNEVLCELLLRIRTRIDFREGTKLGVRTEDQIDAGAGPLGRLCLAVVALIKVVAGWLPLRPHVEEVDEKVVRQFFLLLGEDAMFGAANI